MTSDVSLEAMLAGLDPRAPAWTCQLIRAGVERDELVLDLVALERCPAPTVDVPAYFPFTLHVAREHPGAEQALGTWAAQADVVTVSVGTTGTEAWLRLSAGECDLVVKVPRRAPG